MLTEPIGITHFIASLLSLIFGTYVLYGRKGSRRHVRAGYIYAISMFVVLVTAFMIYKLFGRFGVLHGLAVVSSLTLLAGLIPMWTRRPADYFGWHVGAMYWSVIGLYCAFAAEVLTRLPFILGVRENLIPIFFALVGVASGLTGYVGSRYFKRYKDSWLELGPGASGEMA